MRALRLGSYSIDATLAGTPSLDRLKSMTRYWRLCPAPRWRAVLRPYELRPPVLGLGTVSDLSGRSVVSSVKAETVWKRRPALVGLRERSISTLSCSRTMGSTGRAQGSPRPVCYRGACRTSTGAGCAYAYRDGSRY